jgi:alpha-1,2-mannosyltransferase
MYWLFGTFLLWLIPVLAVGARGLHLSPVFAILVAVPIAAGIALPAARFVARAIQTSDRLPRIYYAAFLIAAITAIVRIASVSVFIADVRQIEFSVQPDDAFRRVHSCVSAYAESARLLAEGEPDVYHRDHYRPGGNDRVIGPLRVDPFHYPPPFLLLPQAIRTIAPEFWDFRRLWFTLQALVLGGSVVAIAAWIGGRQGAVALLGGTIMLAMPHAAATFQQGNFQITAVPLAAASFVLLLAGRSAAGGGLLAYAALAKIFPGILVVPLLAGRRWKPVAWVAGMGAVLLTLSLATQGTATFQAFIHTSLPEISSGSAFPQTESPAHSRVNWSAYGQTVRARVLGVSWLTQRRGLLAAELYGLLVAAFAAWAGWRARFSLSTTHGRLAVAQFAVALVSLASFRSPFVGAIYGVVATLWLMALLSATSTRYTSHWMAGLLALGILTAIMPSPSQPPSTPWVLISGVLVFVCMGINAWGVGTAVRASPYDEPEGACYDSRLSQVFARSNGGVS